MPLRVRKASCVGSAITSKSYSGSLQHRMLCLDLTVGGSRTVAAGEESTSPEWEGL
jgi:hypothetical protein